MEIRKYQATVWINSNFFHIFWRNDCIFDLVQWFGVFKTTSYKISKTKQWHLPNISDERSSRSISKIFSEEYWDWTWSLVLFGMVRSGSGHGSWREGEQSKSSQIFSITLQCFQWRYYIILAKTCCCSWHSAPDNYLKTYQIVHTRIFLSNHCQWRIAIMKKFLQRSSKK